MLYDHKPSQGKNHDARVIFSSRSIARHLRPTDGHTAATGVGNDKWPRLRSPKADRCNPDWQKPDRPRETPTARRPARRVGGVGDRAQLDERSDRARFSFGESGSSGAGRARPAAAARAPPAAAGRARARSRSAARARARPLHEPVPAGAPADGLARDAEAAVGLPVDVRVVGDILQAGGGVLLDGVGRRVVPRGGVRVNLDAEQLLEVVRVAGRQHSRHLEGVGRREWCALQEVQGSPKPGRCRPLDHPAAVDAHAGRRTASTAEVGRAAARYIPRAESLVPTRASGLPPGPRAAIWRSAPPSNCRSTSCSSPLRAALLFTAFLRLARPSLALAIYI